MFFGPPLPLPPDLPISVLFAEARRPGALGAWVRNSVRSVHLCGTRAPAGRILVSPDLGYLLGRCTRIALRAGARTIVLAAEAVIQWRTLQVVTATPYLTGRERLMASFPGLRPNATGFSVPISAQPPEEVLAECLAKGLPVIGSRIVYLPANLAQTRINH